jgi:hypothetical protein
MKKTLITFSLAICGTIALGQSSFKLFEKATMTPAQSVYNRTLSDKATDDDFFELDCKNTSSSSKQTKVKMTIIYTPNGCSNDILFCDALNCYPPGVNESPDANSMAAGRRDTSALIPHMSPGNCIGSYKVHFRLYDVNNISDSVSIDVNYSVVAGIEENINRNYLLGDAVPNPASEQLVINYTFITQPKNAKLELYNVVGTKVNEFKIEGMEGKVKMDVSNLSQGIYFYSLVVNGNKISTKKVVIAD